MKLPAPVLLGLATGCSLALVQAPARIDDRTCTNSYAAPAADALGSVAFAGAAVGSLVFGSTCNPRSDSYPLPCASSAPAILG